MYFGGINGFNAFYPGNVKDNQHIPPIVLTSFKIFDDEVKLSKSLLEISEIEIPYHDNFFSFEFAAMDFFAPGMNQYSYKLEGFNKEWINSGTRRYVSYTNLDGGDYTLRVRGSNNDGIWNNDGISLNIRIIPLFWKTWYFRIFCIIGIIITGVIYYKIKTYNFRKRNIHLQYLVNE